MNLVLKLISSPWFWADVVLSVSGGVLVYLGLRMEKAAEKKEYLDAFVDDVQSRKLKSERGWRILMAGIIVEVVAALGISIISGLEIADLTDKSADAKLLAANIGTTNAQLSLQVAQLVSTNLGLEKQLFALNMQMQEMTNNLAVVGKTANETRDLLGDSNTTARLNETKDTLAAANKVATDVRSVVANSNLGVLQGELSQLKPKPLKERLMACLNSINPQIVSSLKTGQTEFRVSRVRSYDLEELQKVAEQPEGRSYIKIGHVGLELFGGPPTYQVFFELKPELLK
jgi:hypothetical protein